MTGLQAGTWVEAVLFSLEEREREQEQREVKGDFGFDQHLHLALRQLEEGAHKDPGHLEAALALEAVEHMALWTEEEVRRLHWEEEERQYRRPGEVQQIRLVLCILLDFGEEEEEHSLLDFGAEVRKARWEEVGEYQQMGDLSCDQEVEVVGQNQVLNQLSVEEGLAVVQVHGCQVYREEEASYLLVD